MRQFFIIPNTYTLHKAGVAQSISFLNIPAPKTPPTADNAVATITQPIIIMMVRNTEGVEVWPLFRSFFPAVEMAGFFSVFITDAPQDEQ